MIFHKYWLLDFQCNTVGNLRVDIILILKAIKSKNLLVNELLYWAITMSHIVSFFLNTKITANTFKILSQLQNPIPMFWGTLQKLFIPASPTKFRKTVLLLWDSGKSFSSKYHEIHIRQMEKHQCPVSFVYISCTHKKLSSRQCV